jgi:ATP-dependent Clp protease ATP-binding subunit ClpC
MMAMGYTLDLDESAKQFIVTKGYDKQYGARPLKRAIQHLLEDKLCELMMDDKLAENATIQITHTTGNDSLTFTVSENTESNLSDQLS